MELNGIDTYSSERLAALVWSYVTPGADARAYRAVAQWGYAESLERLRRADSSIAEIVGESSTAWRRRLELFDTEGAAVAQLRALKRLGAWVITPEDPLWPEGMNALGERAPLALWVRGHKAVAERILGGSGLRSISIVGARAASARGVRTAVNFSYELARDYVITSGGAFGIDVAAHKGALAAGGHTVIFSAAGVDRIYPASHAPLFQQVWNGGGLVISEFGLGTAPHAHRFLLRNRLIAAFSRATVVVEAPIRSGALSTARAALEIGRPVGAVPGLIDAPQSAGCHELIRHNGTLVASVAHIRELASP
ncbi:MAG: DNA-processing protein DprA, partial [Arcanobacterium sp.]|nr:DNA-processing protein DprA [Arcanobacterium sp.]